ncbi:MAG TPA: Holliday junction branch migration protein RuvA [Methanosarcinales archaeon]|nr:Holliday junction branch migration protein RuvA [Methanosarcinales archaeon]
MIAHVSGILEFKSKNFVIIDNSGIGYKIYIPQSVYTSLPSIGNEVKVLTYTHLKDDEISLYGFLSTEELELFELLITVTGVGKKMALNILSSMSCDAIKSAISSENIDKLSTISGIGKKTAKRLILELKDKIGHIAEEEFFVEEKKEVYQDAVLGLVGLGYNESVARGVVSKLFKENSDLTLEEVIMHALKQLE